MMIMRAFFQLFLGLVICIGLSPGLYAHGDGFYRHLSDMTINLVETPRDGGIREDIPVKYRATSERR